MSLTVDAVLGRLDGVKKQGEGWAAKCPAHEDNHASLSVSRGDNGGVLVHCHVGCAYTDIVGRLGLKPGDLCADDREALPVHRNGKAHTNGNGGAAPAVAEKEKGPKLTQVATYDYVDEQGALLFQKVRFEPKTFRVRRPDGEGGWIWSIGETRKVLFNLPAVQKALAAGRPVLVVEGEKDVLALATLGITATCNFDGASRDGQKPKWKEGYSEALRGGRVVVIPDADGAGRAHAAAAAESLRPVVAELRVLELPGLGDAGDASDWIAAGGTAKDLVALVKTTPEWEAPKKQNRQGAEDEEDGDGGGASEETLARKLAAALQGQVLYVDGDQFYTYHRDGHWEKRNQEWVAEMAVEWFDRYRAKEECHFGITAAKRDQVVRLAKSFLKCHQINEFDARTDRIPLQNGVLDLASMQLLKHAPENMVTYVLPFPYAAEATCPRWMQFLDEALVEEDGSSPCAAWQGFLQEWFGYCLIPTAKAHTCIFNVGEGSNGKSLAAKILQSLLGQRLQGVLMVSRLDDPYHLAYLHRKHLAIVSEIRYSALEKGGEQLKALIGGDWINARHIRQSDFDYQSTLRVMFSCNRLPSIPDASDGYFRRVAPIEWRRAFVDKEDGRMRAGDPRVLEKDPGLDEKLRLELPGILNWALEGLRRWRERGEVLEVPKESLALLAEYRQTEDTVRQFVSEHCIRHAEARVHFQPLYAAYAKWCESMGEKPAGGAEFGRRMKSINFPNTRPSIGGVQKSGYAGIALPEADPY